ncbi:sensor histidine kinase [Bacillus atrophaeus]|uniref:sensor histidine kinase n=1 Tax=Bacillus atrophaeus TaxID=1452 RepID=UPI0022807E46|nr:PocR ligand-binding domain-containing protein [Bacillus atrophaeus]MCY8504899.1 PocR ligand-binding domain-containing protein [Bacillus atrophaeus]MCY8969705.1 PocR ligand-binding domain-containing protein [Bacillus atrophaeus]
MDVLQNIKFHDIIDIETLEKELIKLTHWVNTPIRVVDINGFSVRNESNLISYSALIYTSNKGNKQCLLDDSQAAFLAMQQNKAMTYTNKSGLSNGVAAISVSGIYIGSVIVGQVLIRGKQTHQSLDIELLSEEYDIPLNQLQKTLETIPIIESKEFINDLYFASHIAEYIGKIGEINITKKKMSDEYQKRVCLEQQLKNITSNNNQSQINSHFIFTTLNTIARMALIENASETEELVFNLSDWLRYHLNSKEELRKLKDEIENIKRYLDILSLRYSDRISYKINIDDEILDYKIPTGTLLPIIENCFVHGLKDKQSGGKIILSGTIVNNSDIQIRVSDNGKGIEPYIKNLLNSMNENVQSYAGFSLHNTHSRLRNCFGPDYGLTIESDLVYRTIVFISIPCIN